MTTIKAEIVEDSVAPCGVRLATLTLVYPRFVHSELMTHRVFSRNASSSRAIPIQRMIDSVEADPAEPVEWGRNKAGMQAGEPLDDVDRIAAEAVWRQLGRRAARASRHLADIGVHKQVANRVTEPWQHMHVIVTATDWDNFLHLRCHPDADPTMAELAWTIAKALHVGRPVTRQLGEWHLPFVTEEERSRFADHERDTLARVSAARCARVSYRNHDGTAPVVQKDLELADRLMESGHWSPTEHQAYALGDASAVSGNFRGWMQHRQLHLSQYGVRFDLQAALRRWRDAGRPLPSAMSGQEVEP